MNLEALKQEYYQLSGKASDVSRQLAFAGIAVVWIFHVTRSNGSYALPAALLKPMFSFVAALGFDFAHYFVAAVLWGIYRRIKELLLGVDSEAQFDAPPCLNWPAVTFWVAKQIAVAIGYIYLLVYVAHAVSVAN